jgi:hypothetical protein
MSLLEKVLQEGNYELAALAIVYGMLKVIHVVETLLTVISYKQLRKHRNKPFVIKQQFGNCP